jgi:hypothetical protein
VGTREALVIAGAVGISSSAIVTKLLVELRRLANPESRLILGIIVVEDLFLALYLAILQPVLGESDGLADAAVEFGRAFAFLALLAAIARWGARWVGKIVDASDDELLTRLLRRGRAAGRRCRGGGRRVGCHRRLHGGPDPRRERSPRADRTVGASPAGCVRSAVLLRLRADRRPR